jgi:heat shock 70kDa protein 1/2/6/8
VIDKSNLDLQEAERYKAQDEANRARIEAKNSLENYAYQIRNTMNDEKMTGKISESDKSKIDAAINETTSWLDNNQQAEKEEFEAKQKSLESVVLPILQNLSGGDAGAGGMPGGFPGGGFPGGGFPGADASGAGSSAGGADEGPKIEEID